MRTRLWKHRRLRPEGTRVYERERMVEAVQRVFDADEEVARALWDRVSRNHIGARNEEHRGS